jgi:hypothetical protein
VPNFCSECGAAIVGARQFCSSCGYQVSQSLSPNPSREFHTQNVNPNTKTRKWPQSRSFRYGLPLGAFIIGFATIEYDPGDRPYVRRTGAMVSILRSMFGEENLPLTFALTGGLGLALLVYAAISWLQDGHL